MNGIENILAHIESDSAAECETIRAAAEKKCEELHTYYDGKAQEEYWKIINKGAKDTAARVDHVGRVASVEAKKQVLGTKQKMLSLAFERAAEMISELPEEEYVSFLVRLASSSSQSGKEQIILSARDRAHYGKTVCVKANDALASLGKEASLTLSGQTADILGGLILAEGSIEINCSLDELLRQYKKEMSSEIAELLFG